jgi:glyoxylase-like metal-dependent hydrolase (beta-lactamase superfamily II)
MKVIPLSEGSFTIDATKKFIPFNTAEHDLQERSRGSLLVEIQPFLVQTEKDLILLDTGLGFLTEDGKMMLHEHLIQAGINPLSITKVLISHLHKDHAGGIQYYDTQAQQTVLSFPNATYYVSAAELQFALHSRNGSYTPKQYSLLDQHPKVNLLPASGVIDGYIRHEETAAHSPHHQVFWITEDETFFYGGDDAPQHQQMKNRFVAKYDYDGKKAMELRTTWWKEAVSAHWIFLFYHDIKFPSIKA